MSAARHRGCLLWAAAALGIATIGIFPAIAAGLPGIGSGEARISVDALAMPWAAVARVQVPGVSRCTGFLVGPQTVVTAAHCLYGRRFGHFMPPTSVHVLLGYADGAFARHEVAAFYRIAEGYEPLMPGGQGADLAALTLTAPVAGPGGSLMLAEKPVPTASPLMLGGYGQDRAERIAADLSCRSLGYTAGADGGLMLVHDCAGTRGTSGGPVLVQTPAGWRVAGVQVAANRAGAGGLAVPAAAVHALLARP